MRRFFSALFVLALLCSLLTGCAKQKSTLYHTTYLDLFDTVTVISGYAESEEHFQETAGRIYALLLEYHELADIYHAYDGKNNLYTVNQAAGSAPVQVDSKLIDLLTFSRSMAEKTGGLINTAMGSVLQLWHDAREYALANPEDAALPSDDALLQASEHTSWDNVLLDQDAGTVQVTDPALQLDLGAVAKGYAAEQAAQIFAAEGVTGYLLSVGGNVRAIGSKPDGSKWVVGLEDPDGGILTKRLAVSDCSVVTSGAYQRYFTVDDHRYSHIIDPDTLYPAEYYEAVTIVGPDSGVCDALSTALFCVPLEDALELIGAFPGYEAFFLFENGETAATSGFEALYTES